MDPRTIRKDNLLALAAKYGGATALATKIGVTKSWMSQLIGKKAARPIGDQAARNIEEKLGLAKGWLDSTHKASKISQETLMESVEIVTTICREEGISLPPEKFSRIVAVVYQRLEGGPIAKNEVRELVEIGA